MELYCSPLPLAKAWARETISGLHPAIAFGRGVNPFKPSLKS
ncbi:MAG: hypothetical protein AB1589_15135 [Cyanobacteriota bacterium]